MTIDDFLTEIIPIQDKELFQILKKVSRIDVYQPGELLSLQGLKENYVRFLIRGMIRGYMIDDRGKEITLGIHSNPGKSILGSETLESSSSEILVELIKESEIFSVPIRDLLMLQPRFPEINIVYHKLLCESMAYHWEMIKMLHKATARERYEWFITNHPGVIDQVNNGHIASMLNITPVTLSRVRREFEKTTDPL